MASDETAPEPSVPPEVFVEEVKRALNHLYDFPALERHSLARALPLEPAGRAGLAGHRLRSRLIAAIEALSPGPKVPFRAPQARLHNLLQLHYVEGMTIQEAANELGLSMRQVYRDLRRGEEAVAAILWTAQAPAPLHRPAEGAVQADEGGSARHSLSSGSASVEDEVAQVEVHARPVDARSLLAYAQTAVEPLANRRGIPLSADISTTPMVISTDPAVAQQVLISVLSQVVQQSAASDVNLRLISVGGRVSLVVQYRARVSAGERPILSPVVAHLADRLKWTGREQGLPNGACTVVVDMSACGPIVLVIDDNEGLARLLERYLAGQVCRVLSAGTGQDGLRMALELLPDAIVLDIMMPGMDGWEVLQRLRTHSQTVAIPVVVCSVFNDPELAHSLGAAHFLPKPVSRESLLAALHQAGVF